MGSVVKKVTKTVSGVVGWIGDTVVDVGEFLYDDIIKPVAGMVEGVVKGALDDPLGTIATIAAGALCGPPCAAAAKAAVVAINGGSFQDILISAAATYVGGEAGAFLGDVAGEAVSGALGEAASSVAGKAITVAAEGAASGVARAAINTAVFGGDFGENLLMAAATGAVTNGLSSLGGDIIGGGAPVPGLEGELTPTTFLGIELPDMDVSLSDLGIDLPDMNVSLSELGIKLPSFDATDTVNDVFGTTYESVKLELGDLSSGFADLPTTAKNTIAAGASASISTYLLTGELNEDVVAAQMFNAAITSGLTRSLIQNNDDLFELGTDTGDFLATTVAGVMAGTVNSAFTGSDPSQVLSKALMKSINKGMNDTLKDFGADALEFFDEVTGAKGVIEGAEIVLKKARTAYESLAQEVNAIGEELSPLQDKFETAREDYFSLADTYDNEILPTLDNLDTARKDALAALNETKTMGEPSVYPGEYESDPPGLDAEWRLYNNRVAAAQTKANTTKKAYDDYLNTEVISRYEEVMEARDNTQTLLSELEGAQEPYKAKIEAFMDADAQYVQEQETYKAALQGLVSVNEAVNTALEPVTAAANKSVVEAITQDPEGVAAFNPDEYREMYRLTDEEDPYTHWLASGRNNFINNQLRDAPAKDIIDRSVNRDTLNDPTVMATEEGRQSVVEAAVAEGTAAGYPPELLLDMAVESLGAFKNSDGEWDPEVEFTLTRDEDVTDEDIFGGNAFLDIVRSDAFGDPVELRWAKEIDTGALEWDSFRNTFVTPVITPDGTGVRDEAGVVSVGSEAGSDQYAALRDVDALQEAKTLADNSARNADGSIKDSAYEPYAGGVDVGEELSGKIITPEGVAYRELQNSILKKYGSAVGFREAVFEASSPSERSQSEAALRRMYPEYYSEAEVEEKAAEEAAEYERLKQEFLSDPESLEEDGRSIISHLGSVVGNLLSSPAAAATMDTEVYIPNLSGDGVSVFVQGAVTAGGVGVSMNTGGMTQEELRALKYGTSVEDYGAMGAYGWAGTGSQAKQNETALRDKEALDDARAAWERAVDAGGSLEDEGSALYRAQENVKSNWVTEEALDVAYEEAVAERTRADAFIASIDAALEVAPTIQDLPPAALVQMAERGAFDNIPPEVVESLPEGTKDKIAASQRHVEELAERRAAMQGEGATDADIAAETTNRRAALDELMDFIDGYAHPAADANSYAEARSAALANVGTDTRREFEEALGVAPTTPVTEQNLAADIAASEGRTFEAMDANQKELVALVGAARDQSIQLSEAQTAALNALDANTRAQFGTVYDSLDASEKKLAADIVASEGRTASQLTNISGQVGRPAQTVTQQDIDAIADLIREGQAANASVTYTDQQRMYDVNADGVIDGGDQTALQQLMQQQTTGVYTGSGLGGGGIDPNSVFAGTGIYGVLDQQRAAAAQEQANRDAAAAERSARLRNSYNNYRRQQQFNQQLQQVLQPGATTKVTGGGLADIGGFYNPIAASGIFATPKENDMFAAVNPYGSPRGQNSNAAGVLGEINRIMGRSA